MPQHTIPESLKLLADNCSLQFKISARLWTFAASLALITLTAVASDNEVSFLGFKMNAQFFYPSCATLLTLANIAFCAAHLQGYRTFLIFRDLLDELNGDSDQFTKHYTLADVAHTLYTTTLNRVHPITHSLPQWLARIAYPIIKIPTDLCYYGLPISAALIAYSKSASSWNLIPFYVLFPISLCFAAALVWQGLCWVFVEHRQRKHGEIPEEEAA